MIFSSYQLHWFQEAAIKRFIHTNFDKCTGCSICQLACSFDLFKGYNPRRARLVIKNERENLYHLPTVCNQCENAYCLNVCPAKAIQRNDQGVVCIDQDRCIGCGLCAQYCPVGMVFIDPETQKAYKCELCQGKPLCVEACPTGALEFVHGEVITGKMVNPEMTNAQVTNAEMIKGEKTND